MTSLHVFELMIAFAAFAAWAGWGAFRRQDERLQALERKCHLTKVESNKVQSAAIWTQVTQVSWSWRQQQRGLKLYHLAEADRAEVASCIASLIYDAGAEVVYWGERADEVALELLRGGLQKGRDPRGKLAVPTSFAELQELLADGRLNHPWLVVVNDPSEERWAVLRRQYACGVLMFQLQPEALNQ